MSNKITTLFEDSSKTNALYPRTKASAVSDNAGNSLENLLIYQDGGIEELTDATIVSSLVETSAMSDNGYFIYDDGTNVYKMKGSTLRNSILNIESLTELSPASKNGYFIFDNGTNTYKIKASTLFPNPSVNGWFMGQYMRGWELDLILPCNGDIWGNPVIVGTPRAYVDGTAQGWYDLPTDSSWSRGNYHTHWKLSLADNLVPEDIRAVKHTNAILQIRVDFS